MDHLSTFNTVRRRASQWLDELEQILREHLELSEFTMVEREREVRIRPNDIKRLWLDVGIPDEDSDDFGERVVSFALSLSGLPGGGELYVIQEYEAGTETFTQKIEIEGVSVEDVIRIPEVDFILSRYPNVPNEPPIVATRASAVEHSVRTTRIFQTLAHGFCHGTVKQGGI